MIETPATFGVGHAPNMTPNVAIDATHAVAIEHEIFAYCAT
jgi:hypothetical protein